MKIVCRLIALFGLCFAVVACESTYYNAWEQVGVHKRDILVDRIEDTREAQEDTQEQFRDALEQYKAVVNFDGGDLEDMYERFRDEFEASEAAAGEVESRIESVADVADDLFTEWGKELDLYSNASLRSKSQTKLRATKKEYQQLIAAMRKAHSSTEPVLSRFRDQVLYLKHNLNARAIASLQEVEGMLSASAHSSHCYRSGINLYFTFVSQTDDPSTLDVVYQDCWRRVMEATIAGGGGIAHHHGIGRIRRDYMPAEIGETGVNLLRSLKQTLDPENMLNPEVLIPHE
jgi:FAD/FMN-containing dehydrogenase